MNRIALTPELVMELLDAGCNQNRISELTGYTRQYISKYIKKHKLKDPTPRQVALKHYPWRTGERFHDSYINRCMRDHAEYIATGGEGMPEWKLVDLRGFYKNLISNDLVIEFDPAIPGLEPGETRPGGYGDRVGGFALRQKKASDGDLMIRVNQHTRLTKQGELIWRLPPELP